ncbi:ParA family protein, partial [Methylomonas sp. AM2-LC]|uniref:ParA family protein n=1 Tax=Methylomonas sp. AM2-LC TaxID=3153301 RepID=UPI003263B805
MGEHYGETANVSSVRSGRNGHEVVGQNVRNYESSSGRRQTTVGIGPNDQVIEGSHITGSKESLAGLRTNRAGGRRSISSASTAESLHRQAVGNRIREQTNIKKMKTLVIANQKGGVGKTATLVHLAFDFFERGLNVAVIDLDTQANASFTLKAYKTGFISSGIFSGIDVGNTLAINGDEPRLALIESDPDLANLEKVNLSEAGRRFNAVIKVLEDKGYDICLIDTAPSLGVALASALLAADYVLSPIELEAYSIQGIKKMVTAITSIRKTNHKLSFIGMVASKVDARNPRHVRHLDELNRVYAQYMVPTSVGLRSSIGDALASCVPVWKIKKTAARKATTEIRALASYVYEKMELN